MNFVKQIFLFLVFGVFAGSQSVYSQSHFTSCVSNTGNNATLAIPGNINPSIEGVALVSGDEIAVFAGETLCVGVTVWQPGQSASITVWGDNDQTQEKDGIAVGEKMLYKVWVTADNREFDEVEVTYQQGDGNYSPNGIYILASLTRRSSAVEDAGSTPGTFSLEQNYPNPFNPQTRISYELAKQTKVVLKVLNLLGQEIRTLVDGDNLSGIYEVTWDGRNTSGQRVASGVYLYRLESNSGFTRTRKMLFLQ